MRFNPPVAVSRVVLHARGMDRNSDSCCAHRSAKLRVELHGADGVLTTFADVDASRAPFFRADVRPATSPRGGALTREAGGGFSPASVN